MQAGTVFARSFLAASIGLLLSACADVGISGFGEGCRTVYVLSGGIVQPVNTCGGVPREGLTARMANPASGGGLAGLLAAPKFEPDIFYTGVDAPEDKAPLTAIVHDALRAIIEMPEPRDAGQVRQRLAQAVQAVDGFATEDRDMAYRYLVLAWREAGFASESELFPSPDENVLQVF